MRRSYYLSAFSCGLLTALALGCNEDDKSYDADGDGFEGALDCDDSDPNVYVGAVEVCGDGIDNNCDGYDDPCNVDADGDGYYTLSGYYTDADCDDSNDEVYPGAPEDCMSGYDDNCDGIESECLTASLIYEPTSPLDYDAYDAAVFADHVVFGEPGNGFASDGHARFFANLAGVVDEFDATLVSEGPVGQGGAYGSGVAPIGADLCITADYLDDGAITDVGKSWCFSEATVRAATSTLNLLDASYTAAGELQSNYSKADGEVDVDGDGNLDLLVYSSRGMHVILGTGAPWSGDYLVPSDADLTLGNCGISTSGWCGFGRALHGAAPSLLALTEEGGTPDTISLYNLPLVGGSTVPTATATVDRPFYDAGTGVELISGVALGNSASNELTFLNAAGTVVGTTSGPFWFGHWSSSFIDARGHELLLVSAPYESDPTYGSGLGVVYVFDLTDHGLPSSSDEAQYVLLPPENYIECGWRARGGVVRDGNGGSSVVALSCPSTGGAAYHLNYQLDPAPLVYAADIFPTQPGIFNIRQWVVDAYTSELEWARGLAQTEAVVAQGSIVGWRLHDIAVGSPLFRAGLRSDDVVRKVNGINVTTPGVVNQLFSTFKDGQELTLGIVRNGTPRQLQYTVVP